MINKHVHVINWKCRPISSHGSQPYQQNKLAYDENQSEDNQIRSLTFEKLNLYLLWRIAMHCQYSTNETKLIFAFVLYYGYGLMCRIN